MKVISVYQRYFGAEACFSGVKRRAAQVMLTATSEDGNVTYEASVNFFPHEDDEDFSVSYDAYFSKVVYSAKGRRSKKREEELLSGLENTVDELCEKAGAKVLWDRPLTPERRG